MSRREQSPYRLARLIKRARRQMSNAIRERLIPLGASLPTVQIIKRAVENQAINQLELARQIELEPAAVCRLVIDLEESGLVQRRRDPDDNRRMLVTATPAGRAHLARTQPAVLAGIDAMVSRLTAAEQDQLASLLEKLAPDDDALEDAPSR